MNGEIDYVKKSTHVCDKCGKEFNYDYISYTADSGDMKTVEIKFGQYNKREFDLCMDCCNSLGLIEKESSKEQTIDEIDNFLDILADLVRAKIE